MLSEEANSLFTTENANEHIIDGCTLSYEVCLSGLRSLIFTFIFIVLDDLTELFEFKRLVKFILTIGSVFHIFFSVLGLFILVLLHLHL